MAEKKEKEEIKDVPEVEVKEEVKTEVAPAPKKNIFAKLFGGGLLTACICVAIAAIVAIFVVNFATGSPKAVVNKLINNGYDEAHDALKEAERIYKKYDFKKPVKGSFDVTIESDMEEFEDISGIKMSGEFGYDLEEKIITGSVALENKEKFEAAMAIDEEDVYLKLLDEVIYLSEESGIGSEYWEEIATIVEEYDIDFKQYETILKSLRNALQKSVDPKALKKSRDTVSLGGKDVKVNKITITIDEDAAQYFVKNFAKTLKKDKALIKALNNLAEDYDIEFDEDEFVDGLEELEDLADDIELDKSEKVLVNVYTKGVFNKIVGGSISMNKHEFVTYVNYGKNINLTIDAGTEKIVVTGTRKGKETEYVVKYNKEKIATATVRKWEKDIIDFDYTINVEDQKIKGSVYLTAKEGKKDITGEYKISLDAGDEINFKVKGNYSFEFDADVKMFSTKNAIDADDWDPEEFEEEMMEKLDNDEALAEFIKGFIDGYEEENIEYNSLDMIVVDEAKAVNLLSKERATVLYVGDTYYSYYSEANARTFLDNLTSVLDDNEVHAYYLSDYYIDTKFKDAVKDVKYQCKSTEEEPTTPVEDAEGQGEEAQTEETPAEPSCEEYPAVYFIKGGKVVKAFRGTVTEEEFEDALEEIGLS